MIRLELTEVDLTNSSLAPFWQCLKCSFLLSPVANAKQAVQRINPLTGISLPERHARRNMKRLRLTLRKCGQVNGKTNPQLHFEFFQSEMQPRLHEAAAGRRKVFFVDASHFVLGASLGILWCFSRIFVKTGAGPQRYSVLGRWIAIARSSSRSPPRVMSMPGPRVNCWRRFASSSRPSRHLDPRQRPLSTLPLHRRKSVFIEH